MRPVAVLGQPSRGEQRAKLASGSDLQRSSPTNCLSLTKIKAGGNASRPILFRRHSQVPSDFGQSAQQWLVFVAIVKMVGVPPSPSEVAVPAQEGNEHRIEIPTSVLPVVTIGAWTGTNYAPAPVAVVDVLSDAIPPFRLQEGIIIHGSIYVWQPRIWSHSMKRLGEFSLLDDCGHAESSEICGNYGVNTGAY